MNNDKSGRTIPYLKTHRLAPENQETPISFAKELLTYPGYFFRRNHFPYPKKFSSYLRVDGKVKHPITFSYHDLLSMPSKTLILPLECAGNKRALFEPKVYGEQWEGGAISQGVWTGVPLLTLLQVAGLSSSVQEIAFTGADHGFRTDLDGYYRFSRSLPLDKALHPDTIIAYQLNGQPLPYKHGYPLRLIAPQWYAMASVKWLMKITAMDQRFKGPFQTIDYVYYPENNSQNSYEPVTTMNVNSFIQNPLNYTVLDMGSHLIHGIAWTGEGKIVKVDVSTDDGVHWNNADLNIATHNDYAWTYWSFHWYAAAAGEYTILSRATDSHGRTQPLKARWNRKGYGYNAISRTKVKIE